MKATEANLLQFIKAPKQFIIPIYQRTYSWSRKQCQEFWNDIIRAAADPAMSGHFVGSIVYVERGLYQVTSVPQLLVIDGQQRLTTISLLLAALGEYAEQNDSEITRRRITNYFLINNEEEGSLRYKLLLTRSDKETLTRIVENRELPKSYSPQIVENYSFFKEQIRRSEIDPDTLYEGIGKLIVVDISLDRNYDNPQLIFESLNSTGLDLSQADLIRNYVLMGLEPEDQERIYEHHWYPMEHSFGNVESSGYFDRFMRDYLTLKTGSGRIPKISEVYEGFKSLVKDSPEQSVEEILADVHKYSRYFVKLAFDQEEAPEIRQVLRGINRLRVDVAYPLLLEVYDDYANELLPRKDFVVVLKLVESYVFRRLICGIPTNSLNKTFANFSRDIDKSNYLESVQAAFLLKDSYRRFPKDEEFWYEFTVRDVYSLRNRNYLLDKLENYGRKEKVPIEEYTIEHIMPQNENLSSEWRSELGAEWEKVQADYLHTIGNLTLTGYNPELSDKPFREKRDMEGGFRDSPIRLNQSLANLEHWNKNEINQRAETLADKAIKVWPSPNLPQEVLDKYRTQSLEDGRTYTLADHSEGLQEPIMDLFQRLRKRILNLDPSVREEIKKWYIAYKTTTNFVDVVLQKKQLRLSLNMRFPEINDPRGLCRDVTNVGRWGNGDVEVGLSSTEDLDYILGLIQQSYEIHKEETVGQLT